MEGKFGHIDDIEKIVGKGIVWKNDDDPSKYFEGTVVMVVQVENEAGEPIVYAVPCADDFEEALQPIAMPWTKAAQGAEEYAKQRGEHIRVQ